MTDHQPAIYAAQALEMMLKRHQYGNATDADLEAAWGALMALRWRPIEEAPHNKPVLLGWEDWRDSKWLCVVESAVTGERLPNGYSNVSHHGSATAWMPLPPGKVGV